MTRDDLVLAQCFAHRGDEPGADDVVVVTEDHRGCPRVLDADVARMTQAVLLPRGDDPNARITTT